jgi:hypothetical protein
MVSETIEAGTILFAIEFLTVLGVFPAVYSVKPLVKKGLTHHCPNFILL